MATAQEKEEKALARVLRQGLLSKLGIVTVILVEVLVWVVQLGWEGLRPFNCSTGLAGTEATSCWAPICAVVGCS